ncbi:MAG TPA: hypothetical protein RMH99_06145 [Sandaracinaceae bacterium LLY-WYZ-13_1]|nr:hypothetical protein [Sandaracinaceae bacterium LLY-WYZ-13_1]
MALITVTAAALLLASGGTVAFFAHRHGWRWGARPLRSTPRGEGGYRSAPVTAGHVPKGFPPSVLLSSGVGFVWAALTLLVFAPAGVLFCLLLSDGDLAALSIPTLLAICASGFGLAVALVVNGVGLLRCRPAAHRWAVRIAGWSLGHHLAVAAFFTAVGVAAREEAVTMVAVPCAVGIGHALSLLVAGHRSPAEVPNAR